MTAISFFKNDCGYFVFFCVSLVFFFVLNKTGFLCISSDCSGTRFVVQAGPELSAVCFCLLFWFQEKALFLSGVRVRVCAHTCNAHGTQVKV